MKKFLSWKIILILVVTLVLGFFDLPDNIQTKLVPFTPESIVKAKIVLGLDMQGGSQLDYKVDLRKVAVADQKDILDGVETIIEKRVNGLGVAEPNIYQSDIAGEKHIIVELADSGVVTQEDTDKYLGVGKLVADLSDDERKTVGLEKAKETVGKTIQLEFKEQRDPSDVDPNEAEKIKGQAQAALDRVKKGDDFSVVGQEEMQAYPGKVTYNKSDFIFESKLSNKEKDIVLKFKKGEFSSDLSEAGGNITIDQTTGSAVEDKGYMMYKLDDVKDEVKDKKQVVAEHILIAYKGADSAAAGVVRSDADAKKLADEVLAKVKADGSFEDLAKQYSDDASNKDDGGKLKDPIAANGKYVFDFEDAGLKQLNKAGDITSVVKTKFGYHIIKAVAVNTDVKEKQYQYESIFFSTTPDPWKETGLTGEQFVRADTAVNNLFQPYITIQFNDEGAKLFEEITGRNVGKPVAVFVGGELISSPNVNEKIAGGQAQITGQFTNEEAEALKRNLNTGAIPAPIVLTGEYTIGATLGKEALDQSVKAGFIGVFLVVLFMIAYYRLPGLLASLALVSYGAILLFLVKAHLSIGLSIGIALVVFAFLVTRVVNSKEAGVEKFLSFALSCVAFFFMTYMLKSGVVVTVAGMAGIIMSFGMAVDANILIFERLKEELRTGKTLSNAVDTAFVRAWSAIRDSNFSTLITCAILFYFGSSIVRGFAFNLIAGVLVSMFTAITITRTLLKGFIGSKIAQNLKNFGFQGNKEITHIGFMKRSNTLFGISGGLAVVAVIAIAVYGLNLGIDFKGGTLQEFKFSEPVVKEKLVGALSEIAPDFKDADLTGAQVIESGENSFVVKTKYLTSDIHEQITTKLKDRLPAFTQPRFNTIGPVIGATLLNKAIVACVFALVMIILYLAFAFRKIPKEVSPWRFGVSAVIALVHDIVIVAGVFAVLGHFANVEINALFITAVLTVFGYSVHDSIVVLDRLRENLLHAPAGETLDETANKALNQTLGRSLNTSVSVLLSLIAVLIFGSSSIFYFVLALTIGIFIGTYSSIFLATPLVVVWNNWATKRGK